MERTSLDEGSILQINVLATFALNTRPGTIRIFRALELMVRSLMFGQITDDLRQAILDDELGILGQSVTWPPSSQKHRACQSPQRQPTGYPGT